MLGNDKKMCLYFEELSDIFGMIFFVKLVVVCLNRVGFVSEDFNCISLSLGFFGEIVVFLIDGWRLLLDNEEILCREVKRFRVKRVF